MTPVAVINRKPYGDRTVQDWHRHTFPPDWWAIDLDLMGCCARCRQPLYLIEATTNPNKPTSVLRALAQRAELPALVIMHDCSEVRRGHMVYAPPELALPSRMPSELEVRNALTVIRREHRCEVPS